jgi:protein-tyrosine phosphatase
MLSTLRSATAGTAPALSAPSRPLAPEAAAAAVAARATNPNRQQQQQQQQPLSRSRRRAGLLLNAAAAASRPSSTTPTTPTTAAAFSGRLPSRRARKTAVAAAAASDDENITEAKSNDYSKDMQAKMGTTLTYRHELGINWDTITPDLIVGSCLQTPADVDRLAEEAGVTTVFCLQEDCDLDYFGIDVAGIAARCAERGDIRHVRFPIRDFDPFELRRLLPRAVARLALAHRPPGQPGSEGGSVYIHCTAGMGRAPAAALAYMTWLRGWDLDQAYAHLRASRACSPKLEAVRAATTDLLLGADPLPVTISLPRRGTTMDARVAGLDVGWGTQLPMEPNPRAGGRLEVTRNLLPGRYPFKFVLDGTWAASLDYPTYQDGDNVNNVLEVLPRDESSSGGGGGKGALSAEEAAKRAAARDRLSAPGGTLTPEERLELADLLCPWATHRKADHFGSQDA